VRAVDSLDVKERATMHQALHQVLTTVAAMGRIGTSGFARIARTSVERGAATQQS
jgi:hypothetical protein